MAEKYTRVKRELEQVKFEAGVSVAGRLIRLDRVKVGDSMNTTPQYIVQDLETKKMKSFLGTHVINQVLFPYDVGKIVEITCTGEDDSIIRNGRKMKTFDIHVWETQKDSNAEEGPEGSVFITDADIPF